MGPVTAESQFRRSSHKTDQRPLTQSAMRKTIVKMSTDEHEQESNTHQLATVGIHVPIDETERKNILNRRLPGRNLRL